MAEPFKELVGEAAVRQLGAEVAAAWPAFPVGAFVPAALDGLGALELKDRVRHVARALRASLPAPWREALRVLLAALPPAMEGTDGVSAGFRLWPVLQVVQDFGLDDPDASLPALREMTRRFSAEFAIRPLLIRHPDRAWAEVARWVEDPDPHVRRLASEGTRPRLPWGERLRASVDDPRRGLAVLERLVDDPEAYVRRSVANHLGDVAKDHPALAVEVARRWWETPTRRDVVRHGLRSLLKAGAPDALAVIGNAPVEVDVRELRVTPVVRVGERVEVQATLVAAEVGVVRVDVVWSWPGARGWSSRTFRGADRELAAGEAWAFSYRWSTRPVSTRPTRPGEQRVTLRVLGRDHGPVSFLLEGAEGP